MTGASLYLIVAAAFLVGVSAAFAIVGVVEARRGWKKVQRALELHQQYRDPAVPLDRLGRRLDTWSAQQQ